MAETELPVTRLRVAPEPLLNWTVPPEPTEKPDQLMIARLEVWVTVRLEPDAAPMLAEPACTTPPVGSAGAVDALPPPALAAVPARAGPAISVARVSPNSGQRPAPPRRGVPNTLVISGFSPAGWVARREKRTHLPESQRRRTLQASAPALGSTLP